MAKNKYADPKIIARVTALYQSGLSMDAVAKQMTSEGTPITRPTVVLALVAGGVKARLSGRKKKLTRCPNCGHEH